MAVEPGDLLLLDGDSESLIAAIAAVDDQRVTLKDVVSLPGSPTLRRETMGREELEAIAADKMRFILSSGGTSNVGDLYLLQDPDKTIAVCFHVTHISREISSVGNIKIDGLSIKLYAASLESF